MKVTREGWFEPITMVLETEEEALIIYNKLNYDGLGENPTLGDFSKEHLEKVESRMFDKFSAVFEP